MNLIRKKLFIQIILLITLIFVIYASYQIGFFEGKTFAYKLIVTSTPLISTPTQTLSPRAAQEFSDDPIRSYPSLSGQLIAQFFTSKKNEDICKLEILDYDGGVYDVSFETQTDVITCHHGMGSFGSSFKGWVNDNQFVLDDFNGTITIVSPLQRKTETIFYNPQIQQFIRTDSTMKKWIFKKLPTEKNSTAFQILDKNQKPLRADIIFSYEINGINYDAINDGFLFTSRIYIPDPTGSTSEIFVTIRFDYLDMNSLQLKTLLETDPTYAGGRGCYPEYLLSEPGTIVIRTHSGAGCLILDQKYYASDRTIRLPLR